MSVFKQDAEAVIAEQDRLNIVGKSVRRMEALGKALGTVKFAADLKSDDMLIAKALYAKYPHAIIKRIDTSKAEQLEGVVAVMTAKDLPGKNGYGILFADKPVIAEKKVKYLGDPVALVAAVNEKIAKQALALIDVDYEVLPAYDDPREAMKKDAILIHEDHPAAENGNVLIEINLDKGDVAKAFAEADVVIENYYETPMVEHAYLEPDVCIASPDPVTGGILLISPAQFVHANKRTLAPVFNLPPNKVRVISPLVGSGFGGKEDSCLDVSSVAGVLALKTKKRVYFELNREEIFRGTGKRHATYIRHRLAATKEGKVTAIDVETVLDKGAYVSMGGVHGKHGITQRTVMYAGGPYVIPNAKAKAYSVFTNHPYSTAFRGFGAPQACFAIESQMDELAKKLNMDPIELRLKNIVRHGDRTIFGQVMKESRGLGLEECITRVRERMEWEKPLEKTVGVKKRGRGIAIFMYGTSVPLLFDGAACHVTLQTDGTLSVSASITEMGQGIMAALAQIAAETMGINYKDVVVNVSDTMYPDAGPTVASRAATVVGNSVADGCRKLREGIIGYAAREFKSDPRDIDIQGGSIFIIGKPETAVPFGSMVAKAWMDQVPLSTTGVWYPPRPSFSHVDGQGEPMHAYTFGAQGVELEVDTETGQIDITKFVLACDVGKAINPMNVELQMEGGAIMGIGWSLTEEVIMHDGYMENDSLKNYVLLSIRDMPPMEMIIVEHPNELGPFGSKGIGEPPIVPTAPAIRNALCDALGIQMNKIPYTPERVINAIKKSEQ